MYPSLITYFSHLYHSLSFTFYLFRPHIADTTDTEMSNKRPLLPGDSEIDQLHRVFRELGTPTRQSWPGVQEFPYWRDSFPDWPARSFESMVPSLGEAGGDFLSVS